MITVWLSFAILIFLYPLVWWVLYDTVDTLILALTVTGSFARFFNAADVNLIRNFWTYSPILAIIGGLFGVIAFSMRYYRGGN